MKPTTRHQFTATVQITSNKPDAENRSGTFNKDDPLAAFTVLSQPNHTAHLSFHAADSAQALNTLHRIMQRHARSKSDPRNYRKKRATYGPEDYVVLELVHPQTGKADLPRGNTLPVKVKREKAVNMEFSFA